MPFDKAFEFLSKCPAPMPYASSRFVSEYMRFLKDVSANQAERFTEIKKLFTKLYSHINVATTQLLKLGRELNAPPTDKYYVSGAVLDTFQGRTSNSTLLESRVHGYADSDIDANLDDRNVESSKELGSGTFNTVTLVKTRDGKEWVFKPELAGHLAVQGSSLNSGLDVNQQMTRVNLAVQKGA